MPLILIKVERITIMKTMINEIKKAIKLSLRTTWTPWKCMARLWTEVVVVLALKQQGHSPLSGKNELLKEYTKKAGKYLIDLSAFFCHIISHLFKITSISLSNHIIYPLASSHVSTWFPSIRRHLPELPWFLRNALSQDASPWSHESSPLYWWR